MNTFTIDDDNNITAHASAEEATATSLTQFDSAATLAKVAAEWPLSRFVEIYNGIPGNAEVKKFQDRKKAVARVWAAIQQFAGNGQASEPEPKKPTSGRTLAKKAKATKKAAPAKKAANKT